MNSTPTASCISVRRTRPRFRPESFLVVPSNALATVRTDGSLLNDRPRLAGLSCSGSEWKRRSQIDFSRGIRIFPLWIKFCSKRKWQAAGPRAALGSVMGQEQQADPIRAWILTEGGATKVTGITPVFGGCINSAHRWDTDTGPFFVKTNTGQGPEMFEAEMQGLKAMYGTGTVRVPRPYKAGALPRRGGYIIMEFIKFGALKGGQSALGRQLAEMHKQGSSLQGFGFPCDNTIGSTPQENPWCADWPTFFRDHRIGFQLSLIRSAYQDAELCQLGEKLMEKIPSLFEGLEVTPCLLHGDLWSGNIAADAEGAPVILDPATYYGHNEAEFGMSWCASFGRDFYSAYFDVLPKQPGFEDRVELYKLYHYLNHYNLFGSSYRSSCMSIIRRFV